MKKRFFAFAFAVTLSMLVAAEPLSVEPSSISLTYGTTATASIHGTGLGVYSDCKLYDSAGRVVTGTTIRLGRSRQKDRDLEIQLNRRLTPGKYQLRLCTASRELALPMTVEVVDSLSAASSSPPGIWENARYGMRGVYPSECTQKQASGSQVTFYNPNKSLTVTFDVGNDDFAVPSTSVKELESSLRRGFEDREDKLVSLKCGPDWCTLVFKEGKGEKATVYNKIYIRKNRNPALAIRLLPSRQAELESWVKWAEERFQPGH